MAQTSPDAKRTRIARYLQERTANGKNYFKSKFIADDLDLSSREVGANLQKLAEEENIDLNIEQHARSRATTWKVTRPQSARSNPQVAD